MFIYISLETLGIGCIFHFIKIYCGLICASFVFAVLFIADIVADQYYFQYTTFRKQMVEIH